MKRITSSTLCALSALALVAGEAAAQWNVARFETNRNRVYTTFGLDPAFVGSAGYARVVSVMDHDFQLSGDAGLATAKLDAHDFRARPGTQTSLVRWHSARLTGSADMISRG